MRGDLSQPIPMLPIPLGDSGFTTWFKLLFAPSAGWSASSLACLSGESPPALLISAILALFFLKSEKISFTNPTNLEKFLARVLRWLRLGTTGRLK